MSTLAQKIVAGVLIATLSLGVLPLGSVYAAAPLDPPSPASTPSPDQIDARLEKAFARQSRLVDRLGKLYERSDQGFSGIEKLLDKAKEKGLDVSAIQSALEAFKAALAQARPSYDQAKDLVTSHNGFDASGQVTDAGTAKTTVQGIHDALGQFRTAMGGTGKALREAIRDFRQAHRPQPTPAP